MRKLLVGIALIGATALSACWVPVQIDAPSENVVFVVEHKAFSPFPSGRVTRCQGPGQCLTVYEP